MSLSIPILKFTPHKELPELEKFLLRPAFDPAAEETARRVLADTQAQAVDLLAAGRLALERRDFERERRAVDARNRKGAARRADLSLRDIEACTQQGQQAVMQSRLAKGQAALDDAQLYVLAEHLLSCAVGVQNVAGRVQYQHACVEAIERIQHGAAPALRRRQALAYAQGSLQVRQYQRCLTALNRIVCAGLPRAMDAKHADRAVGGRKHRPQHMMDIQPA